MTDSVSIEFLIPFGALSEFLPPTQVPGGISSNYEPFAVSSPISTRPRLAQKTQASTAPARNSTRLMGRRSTGTASDPKLSP